MKAVKLLAGAGILLVLAWRLGTGAFVDGLRVIDLPSIAAALGVGLFTTVMSAMRWCLVARRLGDPLPLRTAISDYYRALFLNAVLPAGVLGDVHRAVTRGVRAVVLERMAGQVVLIIVGLAVLFTRPALLSAVAHDLLVVLVAVSALLAAVLLGLAVSRWRRALAAFATDVRTGLLARDTWPGVLLLSAAALAGHIGLFVVAARQAGATAPVATLAPLLLLALLVMALPVNVGGWGPREAVTALAFGTAGLGAHQGLTAAVVYGILAMVASLPGVAFLFVGRTSPVQEREVVPERLDEAGEKVPALAGRC